MLHPRVAARVVRELHGARRAEPNVFHDLSDRELEVLKLIAEGLHNSEIAGRLYVSEKTVKSHVSNILSKLHLADRTQAAVYAWRGRRPEGLNYSVALVPPVQTAPGSGVWGPCW